MAVVCDVCGKGARSRGPGKALFVVAYATTLCDGISVRLEPVHTGRFYSSADELHAICGVCLEKLGVPKMVADFEARERRRDTKSEIDVTPGQLTGRNGGLLGPAPSKE